MTNHSYLIILEHYTVPQLLRIAWFQWDGVHPRFVNIICQFLNGCFLGRWIGKAGSFVAWPSRSPHLTQLDIFLWAYVKNILVCRIIAMQQL